MHLVLGRLTTPNRISVARSVCRIWLGMGAILGFAAVAPAMATDEVRVSTLEWAPYTGRQLPEHGATTAVVSRAFQAAGYRTVVDFAAWKRAILSAWKGHKGSVAYFPGYHCNHRQNAKFLRSASIGTAPLGFAFDKTKGPLSWTSLPDLAAKRIGYVVGYASTAAFEAAEKNGRLKVIRTGDDATNLQNLLKGGLDAALIDKMVFLYLLQTHEALKPHAARLAFADKALEQKNLYVCFRDDAAGRRLVTQFDRGLKTLSAQRIVERYFQSAFK